MCIESASEEKRTYTVSEIAKILDIGKSSAYNLVKRNMFRTIRIGKLEAERGRTWRKEE